MNVVCYLKQEQPGKDKSYFSELVHLSSGFGSFCLQQQPLTEPDTHYAFTVGRAVVLKSVFRNTAQGLKVDY